MVQSTREKLRAGIRRILLQAPTGAGKTVLTAYMTGRAAKKGKVIWFVVHRRELIRQSSRTFSMVEIQHGIVSAGWDMNYRAAVQIAGVQTLIKRLHRLPEPDMIIWDECITGDSIITTNVGRIRIDDVPTYGASLVLSWNGNNHVWKKITAWRKTGLKTVRKLVLCSGKELRGTANHLVLTSAGWKAIGEIIPGDRILCSLRENENIFSGPSSVIHLYLSQTREAHPRDSCQIIPQSKLNGHFTKLKSLAAFIHGCHLLIIQAMVRASYVCGLRAFRALMRYSNWYVNQVQNMYHAHGYQALGALGSHGGTVMMDATNIRPESLVSIQRDLENLELDSVHHTLKKCMEKHISTSTNVDIGWLDYQPKQQSNLFGTSDNMSLSVCGTSWETVASTSECSEEYVYDISVADTQCFFANGFLVHNCHHIAANSWRKIFEKYPRAVHIGLTATPRRLDGKGLGDYFDTMIQGPNVGELIQQGYLTPYRLFSVPGVQTDGLHHRGGDFKREEVVAALERSTVMGDAVAHYLKHANGRRGLVFEASIERSERLAKSFRDAGIPAAHVDGNADAMVRDMAMRDLETGALRILCNVDLFGEGVDVPAIEVVHLCRPTDSLTVYLQQVGRGLRLAPGKHDVLIFDHAGNVGRHGRPDDPREWELTGTHVGDRKSDGGFPVRQCPNCYAVNQAGAVRCCECGKDFPIESRQIEQIEGELTEDIVAAERRQARREQGQAQSLDSLIELGRMRGYRNPQAWARYVWQAREAKQRRRVA